MRNRVYAGIIAACILWSIGVLMWFSFFLGSRDAINKSVFYTDGHLVFIRYDGEEFVRDYEKEQNAWFR